MRVSSCVEGREIAGSVTELGATRAEIARAARVWRGSEHVRQTGSTKRDSTEPQTAMGVASGNHVSSQREDSLGESASLQAGRMR
jgi:hypothetical protein